MNLSEISIEVLGGGVSQKVALSTTSASTTAMPAPALGDNPAKVCTFVVDAAAFVRKGTGTVTAVSDGTDQYLIPNKLYRCQLRAGELLSFIVGTGTGNAYVTFGA